MRNISKHVSIANDGDNVQLLEGKRLEDLALQQGVSKENI